MIKLPAYLTGFSTKVDRTGSIRIATNELSDEDFLLLKKNQGAFGWFAFQPNEDQDVDFGDESAEDFNKSPSQRLRNVLYILWKQKVADDGLEEPFKIFYDKSMERLIELIKLKLKG